jgi:type II secretory pathway pseudopilin PulG
MHMVMLKETKNIRGRKSSKKGFTLLETLLSVALLMVLTLIIYQGFASVIQFSANTLFFSRSGENTEGVVNKTIAVPTISASTTPSAAIHISDLNKNLGVVTVNSNGTVVTAYGDSKYQENSTSTTNRKGFYYIGKALS